MHRIAQLLMIFGCATTVAMAAPQIEFAGVLDTGAETKFSLTDQETGASSWLGIGSTFRGFKLTAYDRNEETLLLLKDGVETRVRLKTARVKAGGAAGGGVLPRLVALAIVNNLRQIMAAADQYYLENGTRSVTLDELVGPTKYIKRLLPQAGEDYGALSLALAQGKIDILTVTTATGAAVTHGIGQRGKESTFYSIKAGDTLATIAQSFGTTPQRLAVLNDITDPAQLTVGFNLLTK